jgi:hypothetical protein
MRFHRCDEVRIVHLDADDVMSGNEIPPQGIGEGGVRQDSEVPFEQAVWRSAPEVLIPSPLMSVGRVQTFQNSRTF